MERRWQVLTVVCVGVFISSLDLFIVNIAFPDIQADFTGSSLGAVSWILNAYAIVFAALLVPAGRWADALGRKRTFLTGLALFVAASGLCAAAPDVELLVAARILQAAGGAMLLPTSLALLLPEFPAEQRPVAIGIWAAAGGVAAAAGPPIGGLLVQLSWHWVFLVNIPVGLAALVAGSRILHESRDPAATRPDLIAALALILGVGTLVGGIVKGEEWGWASGRVLGAFAASVALIGVVAARSRTHPTPVVDPAIVKVRTFSLAVAGATLFFMAFSAMLLGTVLFLTHVWGRDTLEAGLMVAPGPMTAAAFSVPGARLGARYGNRLVGTAGALLMAAGGAYWSLRLGTTQDYAADFLPGFMIGGAGVGLVNPSLTAAAAASLPPARFATGAALLTMGRQIGSAVGVALLVPVLGTGLDASAYDGAWVMMIGFATASAVALWSMGSLAGAPPVTEVVPDAAVAYEVAT
ncbi:MFS transporter [Paraconexibacter antarcticus]|uniref:MFS transporter n=1 Tax=Paraconexibacter antarcticus TaxID=2949664 RepID=A0ABY5E1W7_9ACTN|nr:MFS transporter [Paraconexibacter antarcticus]UTI66810.1 MFS transporter [Paraconexibacter antarcticus]